MGEMTLPASALHGASTYRAVLNFPVSGYRFSRPFIRALGLIKWAAAQANHDLGLLDAERSALIVQAAEEVVEGKLDDHFPLDIFQTGSGTSTNTNANEVIANRSAQLSGKSIGSHDPVHPNDHVNMGQSSNDVIPSAIHISGAEELKNHLIPALEKLHSVLEAKAKEFWHIIKIGRTHLMDATPVRLGQEFSGYAQQVAYAKVRAEKAIEALRERGQLSLDYSTLERLIIRDQRDGGDGVRRLESGDRRVHVADDVGKLQREYCRQLRRHSRDVRCPPVARLIE